VAGNGGKKTERAQWQYSAITGSQADFGICHQLFLRGRRRALQACGEFSYPPIVNDDGKSALKKIAKKSTRSSSDLA
jgi:hypothetical protein